MSKEKYEIKEICAEFENIIKKIIKANVNKNFIQEDENLLEEIERNFEKRYNLIKKEVKKGKETLQMAQKEAKEADKGENDIGKTAEYE